MDMVNQDILNSKVTLESKQGILVIFLNLKCFLVFSAGTNLKTMHETTCCAPGGVVFFHYQSAQMCPQALQDGLL